MDWPTIFSHMESPRARGVIHLGANDGAEYELYVRRGIFDQIWFEPYPAPYERLIRRLPPSVRIKTFKFDCGNENRLAEMTILGGGRDESNSVLPPKLHLTYHPELPVVSKLMIRMVRLDDIFKNYAFDHAKYNLMVVDTQGYELECLKGAEDHIRRAVDYIVPEVNAEELYEGCPRIGDLDQWLGERKFKRVYTEWTGPHESYGDALYVREPKTP